MSQAERRWGCWAAAVAALIVATAADPPPRPNRAWRVAAVQLRSSRDLAANVKAIREALARLGRDGVRVAVFPECALTGYFEDVVKAVSREALAEAEHAVGEACRAAGIAAVVGTPVRDGDRLYNSAVVFDAAGRVVERYHKVQLAEPWPTPGDHLSVFTLDGVRCTVIICHDERYPELVRLPVLAGARVVFYVSHESGVREESKVNPYRAQIQARAVENNVWVVHANAPANRDTTGSHGQSRVIAPDGNVVGEASIYGEGTVVADLDLTRATADNARKSVTRGPLTDWWREGIRRVRVIPPLDPPPAAPANPLKVSRGATPLVEVSRGATPLVEVSRGATPLVGGVARRDPPREGVARRDPPVKVSRGATPP